MTGARSAAASAPAPLGTVAAADGGSGAEHRYDVVVPTVGRASLPGLVAALRRRVPAGSEIVVVDDRGPGRAGSALALGCDPGESRVRVVRTAGGRGPAAARNVGWRATTAPWVVFVDDDVVLPLDWVPWLEDDLRSAGPAVAAVQGRIHVPLPAARRPTDWERNVGGLDGARWVTADMAVRRAALEQVGGFDERFPRAYREDTDLALRLLDGGWRLEVGRRDTRHPARPAPWWISVRLQRGNADDVLLERLHGRGWRRRLGVDPGTFAAHRVTAAAAVGGLTAGLLGHRGVAALLLGWWGCRTIRFAGGRIAPGPRTAREIVAMVATSVAIPPAACYHRLRGHLAARR